MAADDLLRVLRAKDAVVSQLAELLIRSALLAAARRSERQAASSPTTGRFNWVVLKDQSP